MDAQSFQLSLAELRELFPFERSADASSDTFEFALALGGTVSAGAYTGGVLDYLIEALDAWTEAKKRGDPEAPTHNVVLHNLAGASGGALNGAILLRALGWSFPHGKDEANPFYAAWAGEKAATLAELLKPGGDVSRPDRPRKAGTLTLFNTDAIEDRLAAGLQFKGKPLGTLNARSYVADRLTLTAIIGNLTGIPYRLAMAGSSPGGHDMVAHSDTVRFSLAVDNGAPIPAPNVSPEVGAGYAYPLRTDSDRNWDILGDAVIASAAFPFALDTRLVQRTALQLAFRVVAVPQDKTGVVDVVQLLPVGWGRHADKATNEAGGLAACVDGGTVDNEPIGIARRDLAGYAARNPREAKEANRAVVLIDPFADPEEKPNLPGSIIGLAGGLLNLFVQQTRYKPEDLALARAETVFSRFLISPSLRGQAGSQLLASSGLGGFFGFASRELLRHDFELGRYDAFLFLTQDFRFPPDNVVLKSGAWSDGQKAIYTTGEIYDYQGQDNDTRIYLPMIPLMKALRANPPSAPSLNPARAFPSGYADNLKKQISARLEHVYGRLRSDVLSLNWAERVGLGAIWRGVIKGKVTDACWGLLAGEIERIIKRKT